MKESEYELQEVGMVFMGPKAFGEIKKFIKEICIKYPNRCPEMQDSLEKIELEFSSF